MIAPVRTLALLYDWGRDLAKVRHKVNIVTMHVTLVIIHPLVARQIRNYMVSC